MYIYIFNVYSSTYMNVHFWEDADEKVIMENTKVNFIIFLFFITALLKFDFYKDLNLESSYVYHLQKF